MLEEKIDVEMEKEGEKRTLNEEFVNKIIHGDALEVLKEMPANSTDSVVTDPPYGIAFMGSDWDSFNSIEYQEFSYNWGGEALRVLKPGGYLLAFSSCRTYHRMVVGLEDAGFEIHDQIDWIFGEGFPKGLDLSKAVDKKERGNKVIILIEELLDRGYTLEELGNKCGIPSLKSSYRDWVTDHKPEERSWERLLNGLNLSEKDGLDIVERRIERLGGGNAYTFREGEKRDYELKISKPKTPEAKQWEGWKAGKQALKPAHEPIVVAQKPVEGNYLSTVLKHSVGGLNIDCCRIEYAENDNPSVGGRHKWEGRRVKTGSEEFGFNSMEEPQVNAKGRFPPNLVIDEFIAGLVDEQSGELKSGFMRAGHPYGLGDGQNVYGKLTGETKTDTYGDSGGASRFFKIVKPFMYCPKAGSFERDAGLDEVEEVLYGQSGGAQEALKKGETEYLERHIGLNKIKKVKNDIPTLKPINLIRWLVRLVTPPNGVTLDLFAGSGTTGAACVIEGFNYLLIEKQEKFAKTIIPKRIEFWSNPKNWEKLKEHKELEHRKSENKLNQKRLCEFEGEEGKEE